MARATQKAVIRKGNTNPRRDGAKKRTGRRKNEEMSEAELVGFLGRKIAQAMNDEDGDLSQVRQENFNYYMGKPYGDEREGFSKFVTREVMESIEWALPSVLRVFLSGDKIVTFDPVDEEDEPGAAQETEVARYYITKANAGGQGSFVPLHHWMKDALMYPNGYIKVYVDEKSTRDVGKVSGINSMGLASLANDSEVTLLEQQERVINEGTPEQETVYDLKIRTQKKIKQIRIDPIPGEECLVDNDCTSPNLDDADFVCHRVRKTFTALVNEGCDPELLETVGLGEDHQWNDERTNRLFYEDEDPDSQDEDDVSMRQFWVHECTVFVDFDGDGLAERRFVKLIGDRVFANEETSYQPIISMSSILMAHKHTGMPFADLIKDLQLLGSTLTRQLLDNVYAQNIRRKIFSEEALTEDGATMEAMLNRNSEFIPVRGLPQNAFAPEISHSIVAEILPVIKHVDESRKPRTGVAPELGIEANALQEVRQEVFNNVLERGSQRIEMLTRVFSETGFRQLMLKVHQLLRTHQDLGRALKIRDKWVHVDPQSWRQRTDVTVNVGLGHNTKHQQLALINDLLAKQKEVAGYGLADLRRVHNALDKYISAANLGDVREYFVDPESSDFKPPEPPPPDPATIVAQAQAQALAAEQQRKQQETIETLRIKQESAAFEKQKVLKQLQDSEREYQLRVRELAVKEMELMRKGHLDEKELEEKIHNMRADTQLKRSQADKVMADAVATAVEASDTYQQALEVVSAGGEMNEDVDDDNSETENNAETE